MSSTKQKVVVANPKGILTVNVIFKRGKVVKAIDSDGTDITTRIKKYFRGGINYFDGEIRGRIVENTSNKKNKKDIFLAFELLERTFEVLNKNTITEYENLIILERIGFPVPAYKIVDEINEVTENLIRIEFLNNLNYFVDSLTIFDKKITLI